MSSIEPIDSTRIGPLDRILRSTRRERREPHEQESDEPREPEQDDGEAVEGGHVDIRV
jgi:hypothetical protein